MTSSGSAGAGGGPTACVTGSLDGQVVLAAGGAGAVGHAVIQLAHWAGATVLSTVSGPAKARLATAAGAHHLINYREGDPAAEIRKLAPDGIDIVAEVALGANLPLELAVLRTRGTIATYANDGGKPVELDVRQNMTLNTASSSAPVTFFVAPTGLQATARSWTERH